MRSLHVFALHRRFQNARLKNSTTKAQACSSRRLFPSLILQSPRLMRSPVPPQNTSVHLESTSTQTTVAGSASTISVSRPSLRSPAHNDPFIIGKPVVGAGGAGDPQKRWDPRHAFQSGLDELKQKSAPTPPLGIPRGPCSDDPGGTTPPSLLIACSTRTGLWPHPMAFECLCRAQLQYNTAARCVPYVPSQPCAFVWAEA